MKTEIKESILYSISEAATILQVSQQTLRYYEERGLILIQKSAGNQRNYTQEDIERIRCIRTAINEEKISVEGIRRIHAFIPCWEVLSCPQEQRNDCPAYKTHDAGCWTHKKENTDCAVRECRLCKVYQLSSDCENIKKLIQRSLPVT
jgi:MerR family transcriptional regulator, heat shock protein HspR